MVSAYRRLRNCVLCTILTGMSLAAFAQASIPFDVPAQPLANALLAVGRQAGVNVTFDPVDVRDQRATALKGTFTVRDAIERLLGNSGLSVQTTTGGSFVVAYDQAAAPPAPAASSAYTFHLPRQSLAATLQAIRDQTGQRIRLGANIVVDKTVAAVSGILTPLQAVRTALVDTGLQVDVSPDGVVTVRSENASPNVSMLPTVRVRGKFIGLAATRTATSLREIPQSVSILDEERIRGQNLATIGDVLNEMTGVTVTHGDTNNSGFYARGFEVNSYHIDGGAATSLDYRNDLLPDTSEFSHVEMLRGSDALFGGAGNPSATVNLVRKRPQVDPAFMLDQQVGSWRNLRTQLDATGPIALNGKLLGRVVAMYADRDFFYDTAAMRKKKLYGIVEYHPTASATLTLGGSIDRRNDVPMTRGLPRYLDGGDIHLPRSTFIGMPWNREQARGSEVFAQFAYDFSERWKLKVEGTRLRMRSEELVADITGPVQRGTGTLLGFTSARNLVNTRTSLVGNAQLSGSFDVNGWKQDVLIGADYQDNPTRGVAAVSPRIGPPLSIFDLQPYQPSAAVINTEFLVPVTQRGEYLSLRLRPMIKGLSVIAGVRNSYYRTSSRSTTSLAANGMVLFQTPNVATRIDGKLTLLAGVTYDLGERYSIYASYADIFLPPLNGLRRADGSFFDEPLDGTNLEAGVKGEWYGGLLNGSLALFSIRQRGVPLSVGFDPTIPGCCVVGGSSRSKGVEFELDGRVARGWQVGLGYTFNINHRASLVGGAVPPLMTRSPRHLLKSWTDYRLPGGWWRWSVGGDFHAQTGNYQNGLVCSGPSSITGGCLSPKTNYQVRQGFYAVLGLRMGYRLTPDWQLAVNLNNVFDRTYYQTIGDPVSGSWYGAPRNVILSLHGTF